MTIPAAWMPACTMKRIVVHWTGGAHKANALDRKSYHVLIEGDGNLVRGVPINLNSAPIKPGYAPHTRGCNTSSIGLSMCAMGGPDVRESPFNAGKWPLTQAQWDKAVETCAALCRRYSIPVTRQTVLTHAEVQGTLGIKQNNKWDITALAFDRSIKGARAIGDSFRAEVKALL